MKLGFLFKRIFLAILSFLALSILGIILHNALDIPIPQSNNMFVYIFILCTILAWLTYEHLKESYETLERSPTLWLTFLLIIASLTSLSALRDIIYYFRFYTPFVIQRGGLAYLAFAQLSVLVVALDMIPGYIAWRTAQALTKRHKNQF